MAALALGPELTIAQAAAAREALLQALESVAPATDASSVLELDLGGVTDIDSAGVQLLLATRRSLHERGAALRLARASAAVRDALARLGLAHLAGEHA